MSQDEATSKNGILRLPTEILVDIFVRCLPPDRIRLSTPPQLLPPFTLAHVCSQWRNLVLSSPQLWNRIVLGSHESDSAKESIVFDFWLSRAGPATVPLDILLIPQSKNPLLVMLDQEANAKYERDTAALIQKFCAQAHRWRDLSIDVLDADVLEPLFTLLSDPDSKQAAAAPRLERLELTTTHLGSTDGPRVLQNIAIACPRLHTVALMCPQVAPGPVRTGTSEVQVMQNMHELNLRFCTSTSHVLDWVDACPNLANLRAQLFCRADGQDDPEIDEFDGLDDDVVEDDELDGDGWVLINNRRQQPAQDVPRISTIRNDIRILPNLTCLELHSFSSPVAVGTILDSLTAPALKTLRISTSFARIGPSNARWLHIALLLQRSDASLEELRTAGTPMNADDVRACLLLSPRLKRLSIGMFEEMEQLLGDLAAQTSEESKQPESKHVAGEGTQQSATHSGGIPLLCPELKVLDIADSTFPIDALASVVSSRFPAGGHGRTSDSSDSESRRSDSESSDGPGLRDYKRLEQICVDKDTADAVEEHPVLAKCISEGLIMAEFEPNILLNLRVD